MRQLPSFPAVAAALAGIALLVGACGSGSSATAGPPAYQRALAYAQCMRSHGVPGFPDPDSQGDIKVSGPEIGPLNSAQYLSASKACGHLLPNDQETAARRQQDLSRALKFSVCMRSHGIPSFPDPIVKNGNLELGGFGGSAGASPQFQAAEQACRAFEPGGGS